MSAEMSNDVITNASCPTTEASSLFASQQWPNEVQNGMFGPNADNLGLSDMSSFESWNPNFNCMLSPNINESSIFEFPMKPTDIAYMAGALDMSLFIQREWNEILAFNNSCALPSDVSEPMVFEAPTDPSKSTGSVGNATNVNQNDAWRDCNSFGFSSPGETQNLHSPGSMAISLDLPPLDCETFPDIPGTINPEIRIFEELMMDLSDTHFQNHPYSANIESPSFDTTPNAESWDQLFSTTDEPMQAVITEGSVENRWSTNEDTAFTSENMPDGGAAGSSSETAEIDRAPTDGTEAPKVSYSDDVPNQVVEGQLSSGLTPITEYYIENIETTNASRRNGIKRQPFQSPRPISGSHNKLTKKKRTARNGDTAETPISRNTRRRPSVASRPGFKSWEEASKELTLEDSHAIFDSISARVSSRRARNASKVLSVSSKRARVETTSNKTKVD